FVNATSTAEIYTLSLHDALPIFGRTAGAADASLAVLSFIRRIAVAIMPCVDTMAPHTIAIAIHCQEHTMQALPIPTDTDPQETRDRKSTRLNSSHVKISYAVFCL